MYGFKNKYSDVFTDSRLVTKNSVFVALSGKKFNGDDFVQEAIANGASCIVSEKELNLSGVEFVKVASAREALALLAKEFYPLQPQFVVAVTGTNGKTSVANIGQNILANLGLRACSIGTLGVRGAVQMESNLTTPDVLSIHKILHSLAKEGVNYVFLEASSHGLDLGRLEKVDIDVGVFTNITHDHLDYHGNFTNYFNAKMLLFSKLLNSKKAIINIDLKESEEIINICQHAGNKVVTYGKKDSPFANLDFKISNSQVSNASQSFDFLYQGQESYRVVSNLLGDFQLYNIVASVAAVHQITNLPLETIVGAANKLVAVPGRMELVSDLDNKLIFVDYAHTPDALEQSLLHAKSLLKQSEQKLHLVFGCGGDRDRSKRKTMGAIAQKLGDKVIITDDNPRSEDPSEIVAEIKSSCPKGKIIHDRAAAIKEAIESMSSGDVLLIAGKGHEKYQLIGKHSFSFDDCSEVRKNIYE
jgi:UDP-N-acetylmuramoyl-L-alanyl-D-glutamate--2,6-diaminopimelate ligase